MGLAGLHRQLDQLNLILVNEIYLLLLLSFLFLPQEGGGVFSSNSSVSYVPWLFPPRPADTLLGVFPLCRRTCREGPTQDEAFNRHASNTSQKQRVCCRDLGV